MPLFATDTGSAASHPLPMCIECDHPNLSASFGRLAVYPERADTKQGDYESELTLGQAVCAIEVCYAGVSLSNTSQDIWDRPLTLPALQLPKLHLRMLRSFVERTIRHARLVIAAAESRDAGDDPSGHKKLLTVLDHSVRMLRREVVRAIRHEKLALRWPTGETSRPSKRTLRGTKSGLTSFVNRVCYAVTREMGCFALPLLPLAPRSHASDMKVDSLWNPMSLGIWWDDRLGWIVKPTREVESSEVSTDIEEERLAEDGDHSEEEEGQGIENGGNCNEEIEGHTCENASLCEGPLVTNLWVRCRNNGQADGTGSDRSIYISLRSTRSRSVMLCMITTPVNTSYRTNACRETSNLRTEGLDANRTSLLLNSKILTVNRPGIIEIHRNT